MGITALVTRLGNEGSGCRRTEVSQFPHLYLSCPKQVSGSRWRREALLHDTGCRDKLALSASPKLAVELCEGYLKATRSSGGGRNLSEQGGE